MVDLLLGVQADVATITFNRPQTRNAISRSMVPELTKMLRSAGAQRDVRCIVLRGAGEHFCGGGDVQSFGETVSLPPVERQKMYEERVAVSAELFETLESLSKPIIALVRGAIAGAGISFVLASDYVLASETSFFVFAHSRIGIALDSALSYYLPRIVGLRKATELALTGARVDAKSALALGMVTQILNDDALDAEGLKMASKLARGATRAIAETRALLRQSIGNSVSAQVRLESKAVGRCAATEDFAEGVKAFLESREARFSGN